MSKVSVVMPIYKTKEEYLRTAIESILNQSFTDFEFLILDDCPEESRENIVKSYSDNRIKYSKNERNLGITLSRNKLIKMAQGEYLAVMDHDDMSLPTRFEKQVQYLDEHPYVGVCGCWREDFPKKRIFKFPEDDLEIKRQLLDSCVVLHPAAMIRKSVLEKFNLEYEEEYSPCEDYRLWLRLIEVSQFHNIPEILFKYRNHNNNTTSHSMDRMIDITKRLQLWSRNKYFSLWDECKRDISIQVNLFKILPLLKIKKKRGKMKIYLFNILPFMKIKFK